MWYRNYTENDTKKYTKNCNIFDPIFYKEKAQYRNMEQKIVHGILRQPVYEQQEWVRLILQPKKSCKKGNLKKKNGIQKQY